jgi:hypothetical protein
MYPPSRKPNGFEFVLSYFSMESGIIPCLWKEEWNKSRQLDVELNQDWEHNIV